MHSISRSSTIGYLTLPDEGGAPLRQADTSVRPAPVATTPLPRGAPRRPDVVELGTQAGVDKPAMRALKSAAANGLKAKEAGVDAAKKTFWCKVLGVAVAGLALAAMASLAVSTGGAALAGAAVIAGVVFAVSIGDASSAYMNCKNAKAHAEGRTPPYKVPMGSSSLGNLFHWALKAAKVSDLWADRNARAFDWLMRMGLGAAGAACTMGISLAVNSFEHVAPMVGAASTLVQGVIDIVHSRWTSTVHVRSVEEMEHNLDSIKRAVEKSAPRDSEDNPILSVEQQALFTALDAEVRDAKDTAVVMPSLNRSVKSAAMNGMGAAAALGLLLAGIEVEVGEATLSAPAYAKHAGGTSRGFGNAEESAPLLREQPSA